MDTADLVPATVDASVMTEPDAEETLLRERIARLNKKFNATETIDSIYLKLLAKPQQPARSSSSVPASPSPNFNTTPLPSIQTGVRRPRLE